MGEESERATRKERIDPKLRSSGWTVAPRAQQPLTAGAVAAAEYETANGPADYTLLDGGRCLGVVEAKKLTLGAQEVLTTPTASAQNATKSESCQLQGNDSL